MTASQLITHLQGLIAADATVADLPVYTMDRQDTPAPVSPYDITVKAQDETWWCRQAHLQITL